MKIGSDAEIHAWAHIIEHPDPPLDGPLHGVAYGAKDIFETRGIPTEYGSPLFAGRIGDRDAWLITRLRELGAVLVGKTHTTAFASFDPAPTQNPRFPGHTPGGSSSGSAAAVAAGMVPLAIGTQTLGSVIRPASFCGICGFKPTFGRIPFEGALPFAPSLDTVGFFTRTAAEMHWLWIRSFGRDCTAAPKRVASFGAIEGLDLPVDIIDPPRGWDDLTAAAFLVNRYEGARTHRELHAKFGDRLGMKLSALIREGLTLPESAYRDALSVIADHRAAMSRVFAEYPFILTPAATGPPPVGLESTGDPTPNAPWTALGVPAITVPPSGPVGLQITAAPGQDDALIAFARSADG
jgi:Asp-tRNA(Asn)/Glu-tRNA(Gln) amidotransferase A subunit family amidase